MCCSKNFILFLCQIFTTKSRRKKGSLCLRTSSTHAGRHSSRAVACAAVMLLVVTGVAIGGARGASFEFLTQLSEERMVFQTDFGRLEMAFYPKVSLGMIFFLRLYPRCNLGGAAHILTVSVV